MPDFAHNALSAVSATLTAMKIERLLQSQGFGTRRDCRAIVRAGLFELAGKVIEDPFAEVDPVGLEFMVDGEVWEYHDKAYVMLHKPMGFECSRNPQHHRSVFDLLPPQFAHRNMQPVGRLDVETTGLLLLSDDGQFIHAWSSSKKRVPKRYEVMTKHPVNDTLLDTLREGVLLKDETELLKAAAVERTDEHALSMVVTEGRYHQVRRMIAAAGNRVTSLHRSSIGGLTLSENLPAGEWCWMNEQAFTQLAEPLSFA